MSLTVTIVDAQDALERACSALAEAGLLDRL